MPPRFCSALAIIALLLLAGCGKGQCYVIRLDRPVSAGDRWRIVGSVDSEERVHLARGKKEINDQESRYEIVFDLTLQAQKVDPKGRPTAVQVTVGNLMRNAGMDRAILIKDKARLAISLSQAKQEYKPDGFTLSEQAEKALGLIIQLESDRPTNDDAYGTDQAMHVGDEWAIDAGNTAKRLQAVLKDIRPEDLKGTVIVEGTELVDGVKCLDIRGTVTSKHLPNLNLPKEYTVNGGTIRFDFALLLPTFSKLPGPRGVTRSALLSLTAESAPSQIGISTTLTYTDRKTVTFRRTPLKRAPAKP
jgi:hypothetical protein